jgi:hypothetical protein
MVIYEYEVPGGALNLRYLEVFARKIFSHYFFALGGVGLRIWEDCLPIS